MAKKKDIGKQVASERDEKPTYDKKSTSKVEIEIKRHQQLFNLLSDPKRVWRVLLSLFLIIVILFWGIAFVVIAIKKYYPYNVIETNMYGATTMKTEDKDVIYWLFNTADLWANSGIEVKKGDELTIRASGASFTAIHHLVNASSENYRPIDEWVGTEGQPKFEERDRLRAEYRINKYYDEGILLMKIIPSYLNNLDSLIGSNNYLNDGSIEILGKERRNLRISKEGVLHFAVNDIVLTDSVILGMYNQFVDTIARYSKSFSDSIKSIKEKFKLFDLDGLKNINKSLMKNPSDSTKILDAAKKGLSLGRYPERKDSDSIKSNAYPLINELVYYREKKFFNAWYIDNLGSFLIVIERKKQ